MKCIILAAGYATRLYPLTKNFPKPLLEVAGKPILNHLIEDIDTCELIDEYIIVTNHKFTPHFRKWASNLKQKITIIDDGTTTNETRLGAVKDLQLAVNQQNIADDCLVMAGDNLLDFSLTDFIKYASAKQTSCVMYFEQKDPALLQKSGILELEKDLVVNMEEKPSRPKTNYTCPPFYYYIDVDIAKINHALDDGCGYDAPGSFVAWLCHHTTMHAFRMPGCRYDIGDINSYKTAKQHFESSH